MKKEYYKKIFGAFLSQLVVERCFWIGTKIQEIDQKEITRCHYFPSVLSSNS